MTRALVTTSWDDGHPQDRRLADLLDRHDVPGTFYLPLDNHERAVMSREEMAELADRFDVGGHTLTHRELTTVPTHERRAEIRGSKTELEALTGQDVSVFCYPRGSYDETIAETVSQSGFDGARTVEQLTTAPTSLYELGTTVHVSGTGLSHLRHARVPTTTGDARLLWGLGARRLLRADWSEVAALALDQVVEHGGVFHLWGHSWEIDRYDEWDALERLLARIADADVELVNNSELVARLREDPTR